jgi:hypothetical protein
MCPYPDASLYLQGLKYSMSASQPSHEIYSSVVIHSLWINLWINMLIACKCKICFPEL